MKIILLEYGTNFEHGASYRSKSSINFCFLQKSKQLKEDL